MSNTVLILGGQPPSPSLLASTLTEAACVIAADSGFDALHAINRQPDLVIGDFDSITAPPSAISCPRIEAPQPTATDFEKALRHLPETTQNLLILGGTGRRVDHFLNNLLIANTLPDALPVRFLDEQQDIHRVTPACPVRLSCPANATVSIVPFPECLGVTTTGFQWNLTDARMHADSQLSQSNRARNPPVTVHLKQGVLYTILNHPESG